MKAGIIFLPFESFALFNYRIGGSIPENFFKWLHEHYTVSEDIGVSFREYSNERELTRIASKRLLEVDVAVREAVASQISEEEAQHLINRIRAVDPDSDPAFPHHKHFNIIRLDENFAISMNRITENFIDSCERVLPHIQKIESNLIGNAELTSLRKEIVDFSQYVKDLSVESMLIDDNNNINEDLLERGFRVKNIVNAFFLGLVGAIGAYYGNIIAPLPLYLFRDFKIIQEYLEFLENTSRIVK